MRKYATSKLVFVGLILIMLCLSIGRTYAYFSVNTSASGVLGYNNINVHFAYNDSGDGFADIIAAGDAVNLTGSSGLQRGGFTNIAIANVDGAGNEANTLYLINQGSTGAYVRLKLTAQYTSAGGTTKECGDKFELAYSGTKLSEDDYWYYNEDDGYYYNITYNEDGDIILRPLDASVGNAVSNFEFANQLYLADEIDSEMFGANIVVSLRLEAVQAENNAYQSLWGVDPTEFIK